LSGDESGAGCADEPTLKSSDKTVVSAPAKVTLKSGGPTCTQHLAPLFSILNTCHMPDTDCFRFEK
jgi:hypothetical protein